MGCMYTQDTFSLLIQRASKFANGFDTHWGYFASMANWGRVIFIHYYPFLYIILNFRSKALPTIGIFFTKPTKIQWRDWFFSPLSQPSWNPFYFVFFIRLESLLEFPQCIIRRKILIFYILLKIILPFTLNFLT